MIYGIVPVGGSGSRLGLPFPKELLPLKGYDHYYPVCKYTVDNMIAAGCEKIYFIHGSETKQMIKDYFDGKEFYNINNNSPMFSRTIICFLDNVDIEEGDTVLYGLPDSYYVENIFNDLVKSSGLVCGLFETIDQLKVDRLLTNEDKFDVKSTKNDNNLNLFWGTIKFDYTSLKDYLKFFIETEESEVGNIINNLSFGVVKSSFYIDLGTWNSLNMYWSGDSEGYIYNSKK